MFGNISMFFSFILRNLAILWDGAHVLFTTGLIYMSSLCVLIITLSYVLKYSM